ncbi:MAG: class I SAM-dependent methyltransferase [Anaerolineae bacterium]|nr:class I SAM-dependent methyltransferase [Anaerolineae bacterium]
MATTRSILSKIRSRVKRRLKPSSDLYARHFNTPIKFADGDWQVNERIVEWPYVFGSVFADPVPIRLLEFGCTRSYLAISLASLGHDVTGIDLRPYPFQHPNFNFVQGNVLAFEPSLPFDCIVSVSVLEHIGLGAYGESPDAAALQMVIGKLNTLLRPGGRLIVTVPFGRSYADEFLRSFSFADLTTLFHTFKFADESYYRRDAFKYWEPCDRETASLIANDRAVRGKTGVNCVGCFTLVKPDTPS